jgi:RNA polymerase sigma-70 factor, ECF subfamily
MAEDRHAAPPSAELGPHLLRHLDSAPGCARWLLRDPAAAEDVVQEAMLKALHHAGDWRGGDLKSWLLSITRNLALDRLRRGGREQALDAALTDALADPAPDPEAALLAAELRAGMARAVAALPLPLREVFVLRMVEEMSYRGIAAVTGLHQQGAVGAGLGHLASCARSSAVRARNSRDITVPMGRPVTAAMPR